MSDIVTERSGSILRVQFNRPSKKNAMTSSMYIAFADVLSAAAKDDNIRVILWHGAGDSFCAGNDVEDFLKNPPGPGDSPQAILMKALMNFDKPLVTAVHGAAVGGGTTMLTHCDFVYAGESAKFQMPFINLGLVPEFGSTFSIPARLGHIRAAELILLATPFDAKRAAELGLVTRVVPDQKLLTTATETAQQLAEKPVGALQACKRLMKQPSRAQMEQAMKAENEEFASRVRSADTKEAFTAFLEKRPRDFTRTKETATTQRSTASLPETSRVPIPRCGSDGRGHATTKNRDRRRRFRRVGRRQGSAKRPSRSYCDRPDQTPPLSAAALSSGDVGIDTRSNCFPDPRNLGQAEEYNRHSRRSHRSGQGSEVCHRPRRRSRGGSSPIRLPHPGDRRYSQLLRPQRIRTIRAGIEESCRRRGDPKQDLAGVRTGGGRRRPEPASRATDFRSGGGGCHRSGNGWSYCRAGAQHSEVGLPQNRSGLCANCAGRYGSQSSAAIFRGSLPSRKGTARETGRRGSVGAQRRADRRRRHRGSGRAHCKQDCDLDRGREPFARRQMAGGGNGPRGKSAYQ